MNLCVSDSLVWCRFLSLRRIPRSESTVGLRDLELFKSGQHAQLEA
uniref:Uncharacterized protein n=1 Tax=Anguilla anguilla TaxID=7936 RepID=A0A0E9VWZ1_ANGAN